VIRPVFYQVSRAYIVGRVWARVRVAAGDRAQEHRQGVLVDAVMLAEDMSASCSLHPLYFHVDLERVARPCVLKIMRAAVSELFTVLGRQAGKTSVTAS